MTEIIKVSLTESNERDSIIEECALKCDALTDPVKLPQSISYPLTVASTARLLGESIRSLKGNNEKNKVR